MASRGRRSNRAILLAGSLTLALWPAAQAQPIRLTPPGGGQAGAQDAPAAQEPAPQLTPPSQTNTMPAGSLPAPVMPAMPQATPASPQPVQGVASGPM